MDGLLDATGAPLVALVAVALGGLAQSATGMGFALIAAPALILVDGPLRGVTTTLVLGVVASIVPLSREWRHCRPGDAAGLLVPTLACTPLVVWAVRDADTRVLAFAGGCGVIVGVVLLWTGVRSRWLVRPAGAAATGLASATLNVVGGVGGPPIGLYAANAGWPPRASRATLQSFFLVQNLVTALLLGLVLPAWPLALALVAGSATGMLLAPRLPIGAARAGVLAVSLVGGVALVLESLPA